MCVDVVLEIDACTAHDHEGGSDGVGAAASLDLGAIHAGGGQSVGGGAVHIAKIMAVRDVAQVQAQGGRFHDPPILEAVTGVDVHGQIAGNMLVIVEGGILLGDVFQAVSRKEVPVIVIKIEGQ